MKLHAASIFDGKRERGTNQIYEIEGPRLQDAREFLARARAAEKGIEDFRKRPKKDQLEVLMFVRASILATLAFLEAFLIGLAYDCLQEFHDKLPILDHDLLGEWDSARKRRSSVDFRDKVLSSRSSRRRKSCDRRLTLMWDRRSTPTFFIEAVPCTSQN